MDLIKRFAAYYRPHRGLFLLDFCSAVAAGLLELAFPVAVTLFIDRLLPTGELGLIGLAAAGLFVAYLISAGLQVIVTYWGHMLGIGILGPDDAIRVDHHLIDIVSDEQRPKLAEIVLGMAARREQGRGLIH